MKAIKTTIVLACHVFIMSGCGNSNPGIVQLAVTSSPTNMIEPTLTATIVPTTQLSPTPDFLDSPVANGYLLAPSDDPACQLPCWQGLQVGVSTTQDVRTVFNELFGFDDTFDVFQQPIDEAILKSAGLNLPQTRAGGYVWVRPTGGFKFYVVVDDNDELLGIQLINFSEVREYDANSAQDIIKALGAPSSAYSFTVSGGASLLLLYGNLGIVVDSIMGVVVEERTVNNQTTHYVNYCLNSKYNVVSELIMPPFDDSSPETFSDIHQKWFGNTVDILKPLEEDLGITLGELVALADSDNPCIEVEVEPGPTG